MTQIPPPVDPPATGPTPYPYGYPPPPGGAYPGGGYPGGVYPGGYPPPPLPYSDFAAAPRNSLGIGALVMAIVALLSSFTVAGGILLGLAAVVLGFAGRARVKRGEATNSGVATAGIVLGVIAVIAGLSFIAIWVGLFKQVGANDYFDCLQQAGQDRARVQLCSDEFRSSVESKFSNTSPPGR